MASLQAALLCPIFVNSSCSFYIRCKGAWFVTSSLDPISVLLSSVWCLFYFTTFMILNLLEDLKVCQSTVKISVISSAYKLLVTNLIHFEMLSFFAFYFIVNSGSGINFFTWVPSVNKTIGFNYHLKQWFDC